MSFVYVCFTVLDPGNGICALLLEKKVEKAFISHFIISFLGLVGSDHNHWVQPQVVHGKEKIGSEFQGAKKLKWRILASKSTNWLILQVNTMACGDSNDQLCKWHSSHQNQKRPLSEGSQPKTLSGEQPNL